MWGDGTSISSTQRLRVPTAGDSWLFVANSTATGSWKAQPQIALCKITWKMMRKRWKSIRSCEKIWVHFMNIFNLLKYFTQLFICIFILKLPKTQSDACFLGCPTRDLHRSASLGFSAFHNGCGDDCWWHLGGQNFTHVNSRWMSRLWKIWSWGRTELADKFQGHRYTPIKQHVSSCF